MTPQIEQILNQVTELSDRPYTIVARFNPSTKPFELITTPYYYIAQHIFEMAKNNGSYDVLIWVETTPEDTFVVESYWE